jgi:hypothetical protein
VTEPDRRVAALGLLVERASVETCRLLRAAGVRPIVLKGPLQQTWLAPAGDRRASVDVDLLVGRAQLKAAESAMADSGYSRGVGLPEEEGRAHASVWLAAGRVPAELHWSLVGADEGRVWDVLSNETETVEVMGEPVEIPNEAARCLIVALHAAQHGMGEQSIFNDLEKALVVADAETWRSALGLAHTIGGWPAFGGALAVTQRGRALLTELGVSPPVLDEREALSLLTPAPTSRGFYFLGREEGTLGKLAFVLAKLTPPAQFMRMRYPVARRGRVGLAAAYLYRPFWLLRWALPGLRSWRSARHLARTTRSNERGDAKI